MIERSEYHYMQRETPSCQRIKVGKYELWYRNTETVVINAALKAEERQNNGK